MRLLLLTTTLLCSLLVYGQSCTDSSFRLRFSGADSIYATHHLTTASGGSLVLAEVFGYPLKKVLLFRLDGKGMVLWSRLFTDGTTLLQPIRVLEGSDGSIVIAGVNRQQGSGVEKVFLARLDAGGTLMWQRLYAPAHNNPNPLSVHSLSEGAGGDLLLGWTRAGINSHAGEDGPSVVVLRVSGTGAVVWSKTFRVRQTGTTVLSGVYLQNGSVTVMGYVHDSNMTCFTTAPGAFFIERLAYADGAMTEQKAYCFQDGGSGFGFGYSVINFSSVLLRDGGFALFGSFVRNNDSLHFYKVLFDPSGAPYSSTVYGTRSQAYNSRIQVLPSGTTGVAVLDDRGGEGYRATIDPSGAVIRQRRFTYHSPAKPMDGWYHNSPAFLHYGWAGQNDAGFTIVHNDTRAGEPGIAYSRLTADTDTLACLGADHSFLHAFPFVLKASGWTWAAVEDHTTFSVPLTLTATPYPLQMEAVCKEVSTCCTLQVRGADSLCAGGGEAVYRAGRNTGCNQRVLWALERASTGVTLQPVSDTSVAVRFTGRAPAAISLIASLATCPTVRDTIAITVLPALQALPPDTTLCEGDTLVLNPGTGFSTYQWQDGSSGSQYTVTAPGTYWVQVPAAAGCRGRDTVTVAMALPPRDFVSDTTKCSGFPLTLAPRQSFASYLWSDGTTQPSLVVATPGRYTLQVTDANGCRAEEEAVVEEQECPLDVWFPTAFTPNGDGMNDVFRALVRTPMEQFVLTIYNRWGQRVFHSRDAGEGWNGRLGSARQPSGIFTFVCRYQFPNSAPVVTKGTFLLITDAR